MTSFLPHYHLPAPDRTTSSKASYDDDLPQVRAAQPDWKNKFGFVEAEPRKSLAQKIEEEEKRRQRLKTHSTPNLHNVKAKVRTQSEPNRPRRARPAARVSRQTGFSVALDQITRGAAEAVGQYRNLHGYKDPKTNMVWKCWSPKLRVGRLATSNGSFVKFYKDRITYDVLVAEESKKVLIFPTFFCFRTLRYSYQILRQSFFEFRMAQNRC